VVTRAYGRLLRLERLADDALRKGEGLEALKLSEGIIKLLSQIDPIITDANKQAGDGKQGKAGSGEAVPFSL
jgi:hypothetical protein